MSGTGGVSSARRGRHGICRGGMRQITMYGQPVNLIEQDISRTPAKVAPTTRHSSSCKHRRCPPQAHTACHWHPTTALIQQGRQSKNQGNNGDGPVPLRLDKSMYDKAFTITPVSLFLSVSTPNRSNHLWPCSTELRGFSNKERLLSSSLRSAKL
jgi:hypothetical protein